MPIVTSFLTGSNWRGAGAFWHPERDAGASADEAYRVVACEDGATAVLIAVGSETGWDLGFNVVSHRAMEAMAARLSVSGSPTSERLRDAHDAGVAELGSIYPDDDDWGAPSCTVLWALLAGPTLSIAWLGTETALLVRRGEVVARTYGHSLARREIQSGRWGPELIEPFNEFVNTPVRSLTVARNLPDNEPELLAEPWALDSGDRVVLYTGRMVESLPPPEVVALLERRSNLDAAPLMITTSMQREIEVAREYERKHGAITPNSPFSRLLEGRPHGRAVVVLTMD